MKEPVESKTDNPTGRAICIIMFGSFLFISPGPMLLLLRTLTSKDVIKPEQTIFGGEIFALFIWPLANLTYWVIILLWPMDKPENKETLEKPSRGMFSL